VVHDEGAAYLSGPPIPAGRLVQLFQQACAELAEEPSGVSALTKAENTVTGALSMVYESLRAETDEDTRRQLEHMFGALQSMVQALSPAEPVAGPDDGSQSADSGSIRKWQEKYKNKRQLKQQEQLRIEASSGPAHAALPPAAPAPGTAAAFSAAAPQPDVLAAVAGALQHVELAFDRHPEPSALPTPPWWSGQPRLFEALADLFAVTEEGGADEVSKRVNLVRDALGQYGIRVLRYEEYAADPLAQGEAFEFNDAAKGRAGRCVTDRAALLTGDVSRPTCLVYGKAQRLPVGDGQ
jgi:hypothetical protein